jgi:hypothetical protein
MDRSTMLLLAAGLSMAIAGPAFAQPTAGKPANGIVLPGQGTRASKLIGATVYYNDQEAIGKVVDVIIKKGAADPTVILSVGDYLGIGTKLVAVPLSTIHLEGAKPMMPMGTKERLARMPIFLFPPSDSGSG